MLIICISWQHDVLATMKWVFCLAWCSTSRQYLWCCRTGTLPGTCSALLLVERIELERA
jgi:hypothetical protein